MKDWRPSGGTPPGVRTGLTVKGTLLIMTSFPNSQGFHGTLQGAKTATLRRGCADTFVATRAWWEERGMKRWLVFVFIRVVPVWMEVALCLFLH